jgi:hypothetical protein
VTHGQVDGYTRTVVSKMLRFVKRARSVQTLQWHSVSSYAELLGERNALQSRIAQLKDHEVGYLLPSDDAPSSTCPEQRELRTTSTRSCSENVFAH